LNAYSPVAIIKNVLLNNMAYMPVKLGMLPNIERQLKIIIRNSLYLKCFIFSLSKV